MIVVSLDPGTQTGWAVWHVLERRFVEIRTMTITGAMLHLRDDFVGQDRTPDLVLFEDSRKMFRRRDHTSRARLKGAGSIGRDCAIWQEYLDGLGIPYSATAPQIGNTKLSAATFASITGWTGRTSEHARDAAMRAFNLNAAMVRAEAAAWRSRWLEARTRPNQRLQDAARGRA